MARKNWTLLRRIPGGHSYWQRTDGEIGIADDSGTYPEDCEPADEPPLLLDRGRPVVMGTGLNTVPLKHASGRTSHTPVSGLEALWVAAQWHMEIEASAGPATWRFRIVDAGVFKQYENALETLRSM